MPVPARRLESGTIWVDAVPADESDLDRRVARLTGWATVNGHAAGGVVTEAGSGLNGKRAKLRRVLPDPSASVVIVEHRDRLARFGTGHLGAALAAHGRKIVVTDPGETSDDLVRDMIEVLTSRCARLYGRRGARNRAVRAVSAAKDEAAADG
jgi:putative resolvase